MSESLREAYRKKGFVVIRGGVDTHVLDALRSESDGLRALLAERQRTRRCGHLSGLDAVTRDEAVKLRGRLPLSAPLGRRLGPVRLQCGHVRARGSSSACVAARNRIGHGYRFSRAKIPPDSPARSFAAPYLRLRRACATTAGTAASDADQAAVGLLLFETLP